MSYDIYFIKSDGLSSENIDEYLETEVSDTDQHFISKALMNEVKVELAANGLSFETFEGKQDDYVELNLETYQISMSNSQIAVSLPYWDINSSDAIDIEVKLISKVLIERGFTGYDPQTGKCFTEPTTFLTEFSRTNENVKEHFPPQVSNEKTSEFWRLIKLGVIFVLAFLLIKLLASLASSLF
ncbi:MAG: hypothetical protein ABL999_11615 [Pyrinomonadaceae bacterium]